MGCGRQPISRLPLRLFGRQPGTLSPEDLPGACRPGAHPDAHLAGVPQRSARAVLQGGLRADPLAQGPAHEQRRRGGGECDQDGPEVGLRGERGAGGPGRDHRLPQQLPRPDHRHRRLQHRSERPPRLWSVCAWVQGHPVRRRRCAASRHHPQHRWLSRGADPGGSRRDHPSRWLPARGSRESAAART